MKVIDLFSGAGGLSLGFEKAGFQTVLGLDNFTSALETFSSSHTGNGVVFNLETIPQNHHLDQLGISSVDGIIGGPPCQGFSDARGKRDSNDVRNNLVFRFVQWVELLKPKFFVMENVTGLATMNGGQFLEDLMGLYRGIGYYPEYKILHAGEYGVPQKRERLIIIGVDDANKREGQLHPVRKYTIHDEMRGQVPKSRSPPINGYVPIGNTGRFTSVGEAFYGLPDIADGEEVTITLNNFNHYTEFVSSGRQEYTTTQHVAKDVKENYLEIVNKLGEGQVFRSNRFGPRYVGVWDIYPFSDVEKRILRFVGRNQTNKKVTIIKKSGDRHIEESIICDGANCTPTDLEKLSDQNLLDMKKFDGARGYRLTTKAGLRPRFTRLHRNWLSPTILTVDFNAREKLHPTLNRGISLREGARIQSFPDDVHFAGTYEEIARQIGNAVPPLLAYEIATHLKNYLHDKVEVLPTIDSFYR